MPRSMVATTVLDLVTRAESGRRTPLGRQQTRSSNHEVREANAVGSSAATRALHFNTLIAWPTFDESAEPYVVRREPRVERGPLVERDRDAVSIVFGHWPSRAVRTVMNERRRCCGCALERL